MINGKNIRLRALEPTDIEVLYNWENDMALWNISNTLVPFSRYLLIKYIKNSHLDIFQARQLRLIIELTGSTEIVGMIDMFDYDPYHHRGGIGIMIHKDFRGKGYASEALEIFVDYLFNHLGFHQAYTSISADNDASLKLFRQQGFMHTGTHKEWRREGDKYVDELFFQKIKQH